LILSCALAVAGPEPPVVDPLEFLASQSRMSRAKDGRLVVSGPNAGQNVVCRRWAESVLQAFEDVSSLRVPLTKDAPLSLLFVEPDGVVTQGVRVLIEQPGVRLSVMGEAAFLDEHADEVLCRSLLERMILADWARQGRPADEPPRAPPAWLSWGVARNLTSARRAEDAAGVLDRWHAGRLPPLREHFDAVDSAADVAWRSLCGVLVAWGLAMEHRPLLQGAIERLAAGEKLDYEWWTAAAGSGDAPADLECAWDGWLLSQRRVVFRPGQASEQDERGFRATLLIYPGVFGMPLNDRPFSPLPWRDLIEQRKAHWVEEFCRRKSLQLRMASVGRSREMMRTAEAYCEFLDALRRGKRVRSLVRLLEAAEKDEESLQRHGDGR
jgi:hypothetical protein